MTVVIPAVQIVACSLFLQATHIDVSVESRLPVSYPPLPSIAEWKNYTRPKKRSVPSERLADSCGKRNTVPNFLEYTILIGYYQRRKVSLRNLIINHPPWEP